MLKKLKGFGMSARSCSALLKFMKPPAHYALLWHSPRVRRRGALTKQPRSAASSEALRRYRERFVLSKRGSTDTQPGRSCAIHVLAGGSTGLATASSGSKLPEKDFSA